MDEWSILDEVDVLAKWPADHKKAVLEAGAKWKERKEALEALNSLIEQNPRLSTESMTIYGQLMDEIRKILDRETNIVVVSTTCRTVELLAKGLRQRFGGFVGMVFPFLIKRAKDKKKNVRDAVLAALNSVADTTSPERLLKDIVEWFGIASPESKQTLLDFLFDYFCRQFSPDLQFVKQIAPLMVKISSDSDVNVREKAARALGSLHRLLGDGISAFVKEISTDPTKMEKIAKFRDEAQEEFQKFAESRKSDLREKEESSGNGDSAGISGNSENSEVQPTSLDPFDLIDPVEIRIPKGTDSKLVDKNWKERMAAVEELKKLADEVGRIEFPADLEILKILVKIIEKDVNINVATVSAQVLTIYAKKCRFAFGGFAQKCFPVVFEKLKDRKAVLREALVEFCDEAANTAPLSAYVDSVISAFASKNPQSRQQTALFLSRLFAKNDQKTVEIEVVKQLAEHIVKISNDADKDVREAAIRVAAGIQKAMGETIAKRLLVDIFEDKLKADKIPSIIEELQKEFGSTATPEMVRLAKFYKIGSVAPPPPRPKTGNMAPKGPSTQNGPKRVPSAPIARRAPSPTAKPQIATAPPKIKPFVARPAPNFGASKPKVAVAPSRPVSRAVPTPTIRPAASRPTAPTKITPIAPNVVRNGPGLSRPQTASGIAPPRSRIASGIARPSGMAQRPTSASRIARPPSSTRNE